MTVDSVGRSEAAERGHESGVGRQERRRGEREDGHHRRLARRAGVGHRRRRAHAMCTVVEAFSNTRVYLGVASISIKLAVRAWPMKFQCGLRLAQQARVIVDFTL